MVLYISFQNESKGNDVSLDSYASIPCIMLHNGVVLARGVAPRPGGVSAVRKNILTPSVIQKYLAYSKRESYSMIIISMPGLCPSEYSDRTFAALAQNLIIPRRPYKGVIFVFYAPQQNYRLSSPLCRNLRRYAYPGRDLILSKVRRTDDRRSTIGTSAATLGLARDARV